MAAWLLGEGALRALLSRPELDVDARDNEGETALMKAAFH